MTTYQGIHGRYTIIEPCRASGGEGEIFDIRGKNNLVLKRFTDRHRTVSRERKLAAMIQAGVPQDLHSQLTWPADIVYENGLFVGYVMPALHKAEDLNVIYSDKYHLTLSDRITIAMNLCVPVDGLHQLGQYVGDGNPENICVDPSALTVTLVDTDSYTITDRKNGRIYPCVVGLGEYLAPEVQRALAQYHNMTSLPPNTFNAYTDRFWLAVHIFALLMNGTHPFAVCRGSQTSLPHMAQRQSSVSLPRREENIINGFFPHTMQRTGLEIPKYCPKFSYLPATVQNLFIRAFIDGHTNPAARPSAREWYPVLAQMQQNLISGTLCHNRGHQYPSTAAFCPWCELTSRQVPKPPVRITGSSGGSNTAGRIVGTLPSGSSGRKGPKLGCLPGLLGCLISLCLLISLPAACTANLMDSHPSKDTAHQEQMQQKPEGNTWVHPHDSRILNTPPAKYQDLRGSISDSTQEVLYELYPDLNGTYWLETIDSDQQLRVRVYDASGYCLSSYISERNGHGCSMELNGGQHYTVKVERRFADTGKFHLRWWQQKEMQDLNGYGSLTDSIEFNQQVNVYQFRCAATKNYQVLCTQSAANLALSIHIYDESGSRLNSAINVGMDFGPIVALECGKTYFIHVNAYSGSGSYALDVQQIN